MLENHKVLMMIYFIETYQNYLENNQLFLHICVYNNCKGEILEWKVHRSKMIINT